MNTTVSWPQRAACANQNPELFFPVGSSGTGLSQLTEARKVCAGCPVRDACLQWALEVGVEHGVWGGLSEEERRVLKRRAAPSRLHPSRSAA